MLVLIQSRYPPSYSHERGASLLPRSGQSVDSRDADTGVTVSALGGRAVAGAAVELLILGDDDAARAGALLFRLAGTLAVTFVFFPLGLSSTGLHAGKFEVANRGSVLWDALEYCTL